MSLGSVLSALFIHPFQKFLELGPLVGREEGANLVAAFLPSGFHLSVGLIVNGLVVLV